MILFRPEEQNVSGKVERCSREPLVCFSPATNLENVVVPGKEWEGVAKLKNTSSTRAISLPLDERSKIGTHPRVRAAQSGIFEASKDMKRFAQFALPLLLTISAVAQSGPTRAIGSSSGPIDVQLANTLIQLQQAGEDANVALGRLRIDKWKAEGKQKQQAQANVEALQRNLSAALPELLQKERANPQDLTVNFKLYRNLSAVYDVLASVTESAGAFGPKDQFEALAEPVSVMDSVRRSLADRLESLSASKEAEIARLKAQMKVSATAPTAAPTGVKKIVVDDNAPVHKTKKTKGKTVENKPSAARPE